MHFTDKHNETLVMNTLLGLEPIGGGKLWMKPRGSGATEGAVTQNPYRGHWTMQ